MAPMSLKGLTAIVTGASDGIGAVTARELAGAGARVVLAVRNPDKALIAARSWVAIEDGKPTVTSPPSESTTPAQPRPGGSPMTWFAIWSRPAFT